MEQLFTTYQDLHNQVRHDLRTVESQENERLLVSYSEMPWFPGGQLCVALLAEVGNKSLRLIRQVWDQPYDSTQFAQGIYRLDSRCIKRQIVPLSRRQQQEALAILDSLTPLPDTLEAKDYIVLDGVDYQLLLNTQAATKAYNWKIPTEALTFFTPLLRFLTRTAVEV